jgi:hypothetical protein
MAPLQRDRQSIGTISISGIKGGPAISTARSALGRWGFPMSEHRNPHAGFFPFSDRGFETFIRCNLIVRVCFLASLTCFRFFITSTAHQE